ncbi:unnamed protein product, partial [Mesorhabditis belari]|uniref:Uncharacterized protein n=1 Tax=Mesorhabditis belari TaxID=2138241 RepID=A0AAF3F507_9BILA
MLTSTEVPMLLQRLHIHNGYRPLHQPRFYYYRSAFLLHNELINVWTHFLPIVLLAYYYVIPEIQSETPRFPALVLHFGTACLMAGSTIAHLLHSRSPLDHVFWFCVDFAGIGIWSLCIGLQRFSAEHDSGLLFDLLYLPSLLIFVIPIQFMTTTVFFVTRPHWKLRHLIRLLACLIMAIYLNAPLTRRFWTIPIETSPSLQMHSKSFQWLLVSGIFMGGNVPERWAPGIFDLVGYGHQLFHLCIIMVAWNLVDAAHLDCDLETASPFLPKNLATLIVLFIGIGVIFETIRRLMRIAKEKYQ